MKKSIFYTLIFMVSFVVFPTTVNASENNLTPKTSIPSEIPVEIRPMLDRLNEIKEMDKSAVWRVGISLFEHGMLTSRPDERNAISQLAKQEDSIQHAVTTWVNRILAEEGKKYGQ